MAKQNLDQSISALATDFARAVASAIRNASLGELTGFAADGGGRVARGRRKGRTPRLGWPKCPDCGKNAWPRGRGYCFEHSKAGSAKAAKAAGGKRRRRAAKARSKSAAPAA